MTHERSALEEELEHLRAQMLINNALRAYELNLFSREQMLVHLESTGFDEAASFAGHLRDAASRG